MSIYLPHRRRFHAVGVDLITDPSDVSGLHQWFHGEAGVEKTSGVPAINNDTIQYWRNQGGAGADMGQSGTANRPAYKTSVVNGRATVHFDGINDYMTALSSSNLTDSTIFIVTKNDDAATGTEIPFASTVNTARHQVWFNSSEQLNMNAGATVTSGVVTPNVWQVLCFVFNQTSSEIFVNNVSKATGNAGSYNSGVHRIGAHHSPANFYDGAIAELVVYDNALSADDRTDVWEWLEDRYSL